MRAILNRVVTFTSPGASALLSSDSVDADVVRLRVGTFAGEIESEYARAHCDSCIVLDRGFNRASVACTYEFAQTPAYQSLSAALRNERYALQQTLHVSREEIAWLHEEVSRKRRQFRKGSESNRWLELYEDIVRGAWELKASDVHIQLRLSSELTAIRLRRFGSAVDWHVVDSTSLQAALSAAYSAFTKKGANSSSSFDTARSLSTVTKHEFGGCPVEVRFTSSGLIDGECLIVLRVAEPRKAIRSLDELGYAPSQVTALRLAIRRNHGIFAIVGSTNAGKSTSLRTLMMEIPNRKRRVQRSVEDPVEAVMEDVAQSSVQRNPDDKEEDVAGKFAATLRQVLRQDPDDLMVGEIRDHAIAMLAAEAALTGHRVLTTMHAASVIKGIARAAGEFVGIPKDLLATRGFISGIMYQHLLPKLCECAVPAVDVLSAATQRLLATKFGLDASTMKCTNVQGCPKCRQEGVEATGVVDLTVTAEILELDDAMRACIHSNDWAELERLWRAKRTAPFDHPDMTGKTAFEHALYKASQGEIDPRDIEAEFEPFECYEVVPMGGVR